jgi:hypothetical protein
VPVSPGERNGGLDGGHLFDVPQHRAERTAAADDVLEAEAALDADLLLQVLVLGVEAVLVAFQLLHQVDAMIAIAAWSAKISSSSNSVERERLAAQACR